MSRLAWLVGLAPLAFGALACSGAEPDGTAVDEGAAAALTAPEEQAQHALETRLANSSWAGDGQSAALGLSIKRSSSTKLEYMMHRYACLGPNATECEHAVDHGEVHTEWRTTGGQRKLFAIFTPWSTSIHGRDGAGPTQVYFVGLAGDRLELTPYFGTCRALGDTACTTAGGRDVWAYFAFHALDASQTAYCAGEYWVPDPATYTGDSDCEWAARVEGSGASTIIGGSCPWACSETLTSARHDVDTLGRCVQRCP